VLIPCPLLTYLVEALAYSLFNFDAIALMQYLILDDFRGLITRSYPSVPYR
jgi:hypothetical protein